MYIQTKLTLVDHFLPAYANAKLCAVFTPLHRKMFVVDHFLSAYANATLCTVFTSLHRKIFTLVAFACFGKTSLLQKFILRTVANTVSHNAKHFKKIINSLKGCAFARPRI